MHWQWLLTITHQHHNVCACSCEGVVGGRRERGGRVRVHVHYFMYKVVYHEYFYVVVLCDVCSHLIS